MAERGGCSECERLFQNLQETIQAHIQIASKLQIASLQHDRLGIQDLQPLAARAATARAQATAAYKEHFAGHAVEAGERLLSRTG